MIQIKRFTFFALLFFALQTKSQTLRQLLVNSDAICIVQKDSTETNRHFLSDAFETMQTTTHVTVAEWLKPPKGKKIPQEIMYKQVYEPVYTLQSSGGYGVGEVIGPEQVYYDFLFLKKEKKDYKWLLSYTCTGEKAGAIKQAIEKAVKISNSQNDAERYNASMDFILTEYTTDDPTNFLTENSYYELLPESEFIRYYKQKGIITDSTILNTSNQQRLKNFILAQLKEGKSSYEFEKLVPMFYNRFEKETDIAIANCLKKFPEKPKEDDSEYDSSKYDIQKVLSILYVCNKSYNLKEYYYSDDDNVYEAAKNLINEIASRYPQE